MAAFWKGHLKFSLVSCRVVMSPATSEREKLRFHTLDAKTGRRVRSRYVDAETGRPVDEEDQVKGYPIAEDRRIILEEDELAAVALESTRTIDIETFVPQDSIGWIWLDAPHHLTPDDKAGEEAFGVIREAMKRTKTVGVARVVLYRRERAVMVEPRGKGLIAWTLRYGDEVRDAAALFENLKKDKPDARTLALITELIDARTKPWAPAMVEDPVQAKLLEIIASKTEKKAAPKKPAPAPAAGGNVVSIMDALRKSVDSERGGKKSR